MPASVEPTLLVLHKTLVIEELWRAALVALREALRVHDASMALFPAEKSAGIFRVSNTVRDSELNGTEIDAMSILQALLVRDPGASVVRINDDFPEESRVESAFCENCLQSESSRFAALMIFRDTARILGWLCIKRQAAEGDFSSVEMSLLNVMYIQFNVAVQRVCRFEKERQANAVYTPDERDDPATLLLDERCMPIFQNRAAAGICALWSLPPDQEQASRHEFVLPDEIRDACEDLVAGWQNRSRRGRLAESQVTRAVAHTGGLSANVQLVRIGRPPATKTNFLVHLSQIATREIDTSTFSHLQRLTASERAVAKLVSVGLDTQQVATELCITINTVRAHLHNIFHKLGVNSRGKLAVLLRAAVN